MKALPEVLGAAAALRDGERRSLRPIVGPRGGCHYINRNGNQTCVARSCCH
ncbi:hypothetical protein [Geopseudomonas guangdongensis]|uniref:hypothetical protein n=1 Tax=Geopseudomonas guangdongensis TaxID=1245526 RepID=UPI0012FDDB47|nr:hypothetical protein [Pseudomonas guangdongensis]